MVRAGVGRAAVEGGPELRPSTGANNVAIDILIAGQAQDCYQPRILNDATGGVLLTWEHLNLVIRLAIDENGICVVRAWNQLTDEVLTTDVEIAAADVPAFVLSLYGPTSDYDSVTDVRAMRNMDIKISEDNWARNAARVEADDFPDSEAHGEAMLKALGISS